MVSHLSYIRNTFYCLTAGTAQNKLAELAGEVLSCQEALKKCPAFSEVP